MYNFISASKISKTIVETLKVCADVFRGCKNLEDDAVAYVARCERGISIF